MNSVHNLKFTSKYYYTLMCHHHVYEKLHASKQRNIGNLSDCVKVNICWSTTPQKTCKLHRSHIVIIEVIAHKDKAKNKTKQNKKTQLNAHIIFYANSVNNVNFVKSRIILRFANSHMDVFTSEIIEVKRHLYCM